MIPPKTITQALSEKLANLNKPVVTSYDVGVLLQKLYSERKLRDKTLNIKNKIPGTNDFKTQMDALYTNGILNNFKHFTSVHKLFGKKIESEEEVVCSINPFAYISHLSAMEYHGLTDKIPRVLIYSAPNLKTWKKFAYDRMEKDFKGVRNNALPKLSLIDIEKFGKKNIIAFNSVHTGAYINIKNSALRISSLGRTFLDMIRKPDLCGGIYTVIQSFEEHVDMYLNLIVDEIDRNGNKIEKVRAGYIIEERCGFKNNETIDKWKSFAQRGGSRKLDPNNEYSSKYSEAWCLSLNIEL
jgi:predicted transcriptional regulator of viral defense system